MARERADDYEDEDDRPRRRRRDEEENDYDDRPRRKKLQGMDALFAKTSMVGIILFGLCCGLLALVLGIVGLVTCKDQKARRNATIVVVISAVMIAVNGIFYFVMAVLNQQGVLK
jgi:hypothetical protein